MNDGNEGKLPQFQDTVPLDSPLAETPPQNLHIDTELVDDSESDTKTCPIFPCDYMDEMVLDSEDEEVNGSRVVRITNSSRKGIEEFALELVSTQREPSLPWGIAKVKVENSSASTVGKCSTGNEVLLANIWNGDGEKEKDQPTISACDCKPVLLNYTGSDELRELSQAEALGFVDHFVSINSVELSEETGYRDSSREKSPPVSSITGSRSLARKLHNQTEEMGTFDWVDDNPQRKVLQYYRKKKRSVMKHQGAGKGYDKEHSRLDNECKEESRISRHDEEVTCSSYLHLSLAEARGKDGSGDYGGKPANELESQLDADVTTDALDTYEIGFNTQIAAEAMEALASGSPDDCSFADSYSGKVNPNNSLSCVIENEDHLKHPSPEKSVCRNIRDIVRNVKRRKRSAIKFKVTCSSSNKQSEIQKFLPDLVTTNQVIRSQFANNHPSCTNSSYKNEVTRRRHPKPYKQIKVEGALLQNNCGVGMNVTSSSASVEHSSLKKENLLGQSISPLAHHIGRDSKKISQDKSNGAEEIRKSCMELDILTHKRKRSSMHPDKLNMPQFRRKCSTEGAININFSISSKLSTWRYPKGKRTRTRAKNHSNSACVVNSQLKTVNRKDVSLQERISGKNDANWKNESPSCSSPGQLFYSSTNCSGRSLQNFVTSAGFVCERTIINMRTPHVGLAIEENHSSVASADKSAKPSTPECTMIFRPKLTKKISTLNYLSHDYHKKPCNTNTTKSSLSKELIRLGVPESIPHFILKDLRRRKDMSHVRVLFSQHLDADIIKQQKKIAARLGITIALCSVDATHFIADKFARTRNMLEAIALGKPVVTHLWLESCGQASCFIDEKNYILRDTKKEKEIGFSMPVSLARANQHPLLEGKKVFITTNIKPDKEMITDLVKAVSGLPLEEVNLTALEDEKVAHEILILSCNEDQALCLPFLKKGSSVYSSEFLLNGIVTQKLEYERYQLFTKVA